MDQESRAEMESRFESLKEDIGRLFDAKHELEKRVEELEKQISFIIRHHEDLHLLQ